MKVTADDDGFTIYVKREEVKLAVRDHLMLEKFKDFMFDKMCDAQYEYKKRKEKENV